MLQELLIINKWIQQSHINIDVSSKVMKCLGLGIRSQSEPPHVSSSLLHSAKCLRSEYLIKVRTAHVSRSLLHSAKYLHAHCLIEVRIDTR